jgi:nucleotide-binding universal stress UspA family protein
LIRKILVALDGSDHAERALDFALDLAHQYSAEVQLLSVVIPCFLPSQSMYLIKSEAIDECIKQLETVFRGVLSKADGKVKKERPYLKVSTKLETGDPAEKIVETAKRGNFDIIIMGSRGLGRKKYALGSVSSKVADNAPCPVLICR